MRVLRLDDVLADVVQREAGTSGIRLVGVDGPSGSGKNTLAARLAARAHAPLIEIDDFVSWSDFAGWWPRFESQVLLPLTEGSDAHYQVRDWSNDEFGTSLDGWKTVPWAPLVIWRESPAPAVLRRTVSPFGSGWRPRAISGWTVAWVETVRLIGNVGSTGWPKSSSSSPTTAPAPGPTCGSMATRASRTIKKPKSTLD